MLTEHPDMPPLTGRLIVALVWLAIAAACLPARAQEAPEDLPDEPVAVPGGAAEKAAPDEDLDLGQWVFNGHGLDKVQGDFEKSLQNVIARFDGKYHLTPAQKRKLTLAGGLDIKRFFDRYATLKAEFVRTKGDWNKVGNQVFELRRICNLPYAELFGDESMLAKTLKKNLTAEQVANHDRNIYRVRVEWMAGLLDRRLKLTPDQHRRLVDLLAAETPPLGRYGNFDYDAIMFQMSRLPAGRIRGVLGESQCRDLTLRFEQARRMEGLLVSEGYIRPTAAAASTGGGATPAAARPHHEEARR